MLDQVKLYNKKKNIYQMKIGFLFIPYLVCDEILFAGIFSFVIGEIKYCSPECTVNILSRKIKVNG
jgi:hypothetical protein